MKISNRTQNIFKPLAGFLIIILFVMQTVLAGEDHIKETEQWHSERIKGLKKEHGWLSLIALDWLKEGKNPIGSIGTATVRKGTVILSLKKGVTGTLNGTPFTKGAVIPDKDKVLTGSKAIQVIERGGKFAVRIWDAESVARKNFSGIDRYAVGEQWRVTAKWEQYPMPKTIDVPTVIPGLVQKGSVPGAAVFTLNGNEYRLEPTLEEGSKELFFVFGDKTNGKETYGAGRFLYAGPPEGGVIVLDFNRSYNPPCVFSDYATCPVPTKENRLPVRIEAGERNYKHH
jgi:uncharacterized protein (DUF1684 family)